MLCIGHLSLNCLLLLEFESTVKDDCLLHRTNSTLTTSPRKPANHAVFANFWHLDSTGMRFALLEASVAIAMAMHKFSLLPSSKNPVGLGRIPVIRLIIYVG